MTMREAGSLPVVGYMSGLQSLANWVERSAGPGDVLPESGSMEQDRRYQNLSKITTQLDSGILRA